MKFTLDIAQTVPRGLYNFLADAGSGSITLSYAPSGTMRLVNTTSVTNGVVTGSPTDLLQLPTCRFKAALTGDATFELVKA